MSADNLNHLGPDIVSSVIAHLCDSILDDRYGMAECFQVKELASVCRLWDKCIAARTSDVLILERGLIAGSTEKGCANKHVFCWQSNVSDIRRHKREHQVREVRIILNDECLCPLEMGTALSNLDLNRRPWRSVKNLTFIGPGIISAAANMEEHERHDHALFVSGAITDLLPAVVHIQYHPARDNNIPVYDLGFNAIYGRYKAFEMIVKKLYPQLESLACYQPFPRSCLAEVSKYLTSLKIHAQYLESSSRTAHFSAGCLRLLEIYQIQSGVPWHLFGCKSNGELRFARLEQLLLTFDSFRDQSVVQSFTTGRFVPLFPTLRVLAISHGLLYYTDILTRLVDKPLTILALNEFIDHIRRIEPQTIAKVNCFRVLLRGQKSGASVRLPRSWFTRLYETTSEMEEAQLVNAWYPMPCLIRWLKLQRLSINVDILASSSFARLISQLPVIRYLRIVCISMCTENLENSHWQDDGNVAEATAVTPVLEDGPLSTTLSEICLRSDEYFDVDGIVVIATRLPALGTLSVLERHMEAVDAKLKALHHEICVNEYVFKRFSLFP